MNWSLNELEAMARKAARGAGYSWGLAEEAGKATRWLSAAGLPGPASLLQLLAAVDRTDFQVVTPRVSAGHCSAEAGTLCPLFTGVALCDGALEFSPPQALTLSNLSVPLLLLPFIGQVFGTSMYGAHDLGSQSHGCNGFATVRLGWAGVKLTLDQGVVYLEGDADDLSCAHAVRATLEPVAADWRPTAEPVPMQSRGTLDERTAAGLDDFAQRTFAPATEASRLAGAGAGLSDND